MARLSNLRNPGKHRAQAAAALDGQAGLAGNNDLLAVTIDAAGRLIVANRTDAIGVIITTEGSHGSAPNPNQVVGLEEYTIIRHGEIIGIDNNNTTPAFNPGDRVYAGAAGAIVDDGDVGGPGTYIGYVDETGNRLVVDMRAQPDA